MTNEKEVWKAVREGRGKEMTGGREMKGRKLRRKKRKVC